jgi:hypothetical protein
MTTASHTNVHTASGTATTTSRSAVQTAAAERRRRRLAGTDQPTAAAAHSVRIDYRSDWSRFLGSQPTRLAEALEAELAACDGERDDEAADAALARAVARAATDDAAARLVLRRILPGLVAIARRRCCTSLRPASDVLHDLVATAWIAIRTYPIERRPARVASNLVRDTEYLLFVRENRLRRVDETSTDSHTDREPAADFGEASSQVITLLTEGRAAGIDPQGLALLGRLTLTDVSVSAVATELDVSPRTVLNRRKAVERALFDLVHADLQAA